MKLFNILVCTSLIIFLVSCGEGKSGSSESSLSSSSLSSSYKYFVYVANSLDNTISSFTMSHETGLLKAIETTSAGVGGQPIAMVVSASGKKLYVGKGASGNDSNLQIFNIDKLTGGLTPFQNFRVSPSSNFLESIIKIIPSSDGQFVYVFTAQGEAKIYSVSSLTGNLILIKSLGIVASTSSILHPNGELLMAGSTSGINFWPINKMNGEIDLSKSIFSLSIFAPKIDSIILSTEGTKMYSAYSTSGYGLINSYNLDLSSKSASFIETTSVGNSVGGLAISNFGKVLIATEPNTNLLHSFFISTNGNLTKVDSKATESYPQQVAFFPDGKYALLINKVSKSLTTFLVEENNGTLKSIGSIVVGNEPTDFVISTP